MSQTGDRPEENASSPSTDGETGSSHQESPPKSGNANGNDEPKTLSLEELLNNIRGHLTQALLVISPFMLFYGIVWTVAGYKLDHWLIVARRLRTSGIPAIEEVNPNRKPIFRRLQEGTNREPLNCIRDFEQQALKNLENIEDLKSVIKIVLPEVQFEKSDRTVKQAPASGATSGTEDSTTSDENSPPPSNRTNSESNNNTETSDDNSPASQNEANSDLNSNNGTVVPSINEIRSLISEIQLNKVALAEKIREKKKLQSDLQSRIDTNQAEISNLDVQVEQAERRAPDTQPAQPNAGSPPNTPNNNEIEQRRQTLQNFIDRDQKDLSLIGDSIKVLETNLNSVDISLVAIKDLMAQLGIRDASSVEVERLAEQVDLIEERIITYGDVAKFFFVRYRSSAATASMALMATGVCLFFITKKGWAQASPNLINALFCFAGLYILFSGLPNLFLYEENFNQNLILYFQYVNLMHETCTVFSTGVAKSPDASTYEDIDIAVLIHQVDQRLRKLNLNNIGLDRRRILDFRFDFEEIESLTQPSSPTPTPSNNLSGSSE